VAVSNREERYSHIYSGARGGHLRLLRLASQQAIGGTEARGAGGVSRLPRF
jgi:hypothetical protein